METITLQDCIEKYNKGYAVWICDGKIIGFVYEKSVADCKSNNALIIAD